jgi:TfoX/Sxy family transcriptional regulator of competence genes
MSDVAYDESFADRIRQVLGDDPGVDERKMFGGIAFLLDGNMFVGIARNELMVRVGPDAWQDALAQPHTREMDFTGRSMKGYVFVDPEGIAEDDELRAWIDRALEFVGTLPPK